jgi:hypothetical protein
MTLLFLNEEFQDHAVVHFVVEQKEQKLVSHFSVPLLVQVLHNILEPASLEVFELDLTFEVTLHFPIFLE